MGDTLVSARQRVISLYDAWGKSEKAKEWRAMVDAQPIK
jgi:hypothetical protein